VAFVVTCAPLFKPAENEKVSARSKARLLSTLLHVFLTIDLSVAAAQTMGTFEIQAR
jgi:hypothetical protein